MRAGHTTQSRFAGSRPWMPLEVSSNGSLLPAGAASPNECEPEAVGGYYQLSIAVPQMTTNFVV